MLSTQKLNLCGRESEFPFLLPAINGSIFVCDSERRLGAAERAKGAHMADLVKLQKRLNEDAALREDFLRNPGKTLADAGVKLTPAMRKSLRTLVSKVKKPRKPKAGSSVTAAARRKDVAISIAIRKDF